MSSRGICVAVKEKLTKDSGVAGSYDFNHIVEKLQAKPKARGKLQFQTNICSNSAILLLTTTPSGLFFIAGVIVFGSDQEVAELMKAVKRLNATGQFNWIGSDGWSARALVSNGKKKCMFAPLSLLLYV